MGEEHFVYNKATHTKINKPVFPVALPTQIFGADPKVFIGIVRQALLKSEPLFYIEYVNVKKYLKKQNSLPIPTLFLI